MTRKFLQIIASVIGILLIGMSGLFVSQSFAGVSFEQPSQEESNQYEKTLKYCNDLLKQRNQSEKAVVKISKKIAPLQKELEFQRSKLIVIKNRKPTAYELHNNTMVNAKIKRVSAKLKAVTKNLDAATRKTDRLNRILIKSIGYDGSCSGFISASNI